MSKRRKKTKKVSERSIHDFAKKWKCTPEEIAHAIKEGAVVESKEHGRKLGRSAALDHIWRYGIHYYSELDKMENDLKAQGKGILNKKQIDTININGETVKVFTINGTYVRDNQFTDWVMGGHHHVSDDYLFIPDGEIWIDEGMNEKDTKATILHEATEYKLMKYKGLDYPEAHDKSNVVEGKMRKSDTIEDMEEMVATAKGGLKESGVWYHGSKIKGLKKEDIATYANYLFVNKKKGEIIGYAGDPEVGELYTEQGELFGALYKIGFTPKKILDKKSIKTLPKDKVSTEFKKVYLKNDLSPNTDNTHKEWMDYLIKQGYDFVNMDYVAEGDGIILDAGKNIESIEPVTVETGKGGVKEAEIKKSKSYDKDLKTALDRVKEGSVKLKDEIYYIYEYIKSRPTRKQKTFDEIVPHKEEIVVEWGWGTLDRKMDESRNGYKLLYEIKNGEIIYSEQTATGKGGEKEPSDVDQAAKQAILALDVKKYVKIYKLHKLGLTNKEVAEAADTNVGAVWNALKKYEDNPELKKEADNIKVSGAEKKEPIKTEDKPAAQPVEPVKTEPVVVEKKTDVVVTDKGIIDKIIALDCKKHIKIYKLLQLGLSRKEVAELLGTNPGHVGNVIKDYNENPEKKAEADKIVISGEVKPKISTEPLYKKGDVVYYSSDKNPNQIARIIHPPRWDKEYKLWEYKLRTVKPDTFDWTGEFPEGLHADFTEERSIYGKVESVEKPAEVKEPVETVKPVIESPEDILRVAGIEPTIEQLMDEFEIIEKMPYGSQEQHDAVDEWYKRFIDFEEKNKNVYELIDALEVAWKKIHNSDVGYKARRRYIESKDVAASIENIQKYELKDIDTLRKAYTNGIKDGLDQRILDAMQEQLNKLAALEKEKLAEPPITEVETEDKVKYTVGEIVNTALNDNTYIIESFQTKDAPVKGFISKYAVLRPTVIIIGKHPVTYSEEEGRANLFEVALSDLVKITEEIPDRPETTVETLADKNDEAVLKMIKERGADRTKYSRDDIQKLYWYKGVAQTPVNVGQDYFWEFFTPDEIVKLCWGLAYKYGFTASESRKILDPSCRVGRFLRYAPDYCQVKAYEGNKTNWTIAKLLYPKFDIINDQFDSSFYMKGVKGRWEVKSTTDTFNLIIGQPAYKSVYDTSFSIQEEKAIGHVESLEAYYLLRSAKSLERNGLMVMVIPSEIIDNDGKYAGLKDQLFKEVVMLDAYRLPAKTMLDFDITLDIVVFQKN